MKISISNGFPKISKTNNAFPGNHLRTRNMTNIRNSKAISQKTIRLCSIQHQLSHLRNLADILKTIPSVARRVKRSHKSSTGSCEDVPAPAWWCSCILARDLRVHPPAKVAISYANVGVQHLSSDALFMAPRSYLLKGTCKLHNSFSRLSDGFCNRCRFYLFVQIVIVGLKIWFCGFFHRRTRLTGDGRFGKLYVIKIKSRQITRTEVRTNYQNWLLS